MSKAICQGCMRHCDMDHRLCDKPLAVARERCGGCACNCYMNHRLCDGRGMDSQSDPAMVSFEQREG